MQVHDKLIKEAAKRHLAPLGGIQKGRSRIWLVDCGWYAAVVEFQPSSWSKGAYLNVGAHFLWSSTTAISFDFGYRKEGHVEFVDEQQFAAEADLLAQRAAQEVGLLRTKLHSPLAVHSMTPKNTGEEWIDRFHRGVSLGLAGRAADAAFVLDSKQEESAQLIPLLPDATAFEKRIVEQIEVRRNALKLPALNGALWNLGTTNA
ncbi:hypothetical protein [Duganella sp. Root1480D1]|uniref:hypothetical protein n=1 Tax=Duganella sp. Root1480D1 TaxID=1736471 RepID=UPI00070E5407|nr:hypothetical protein [Duganella sp. Root1480D1]KQZ26856.1 hypothetical protein ASD58_14810 [Duganella sp. Root1480D1]